MSGDPKETPLQRRKRRLSRAINTGRHDQAESALGDLWQLRPTGRPDPIHLRPDLVVARKRADGSLVPPVAPELIAPRGIALAFYLLAVFAAQCHGGDDVATNPLDFIGTGEKPSWVDLVALDVAYNATAQTYEARTRQNRTYRTACRRQVTSALGALARHDLVDIPQRANGSLDYQRFTLMHEGGRGSYVTPRHYTIPDYGIGIPREFFTSGWINVLTSSEIATWLVLRFLKHRFPDRHDQTGVFLYGQVRWEAFGLKRDAYQDACRTLVALNLIERVSALPEPPTAGPTESEADSHDLFISAADLAGVDAEEGPHRPHRYRFTDAGLSQKASTILLNHLEHEEKERLLAENDRRNAQSPTGT